MTAMNFDLEEWFPKEKSHKKNEPAEKRIWGPSKSSGTGPISLILFFLGTTFGWGFGELEAAHIWSTKGSRLDWFWNPSPFKTKDCLISIIGLIFQIYNEVYDETSKL